MFTASQLVDNPLKHNVFGSVNFKKEVDVCDGIIDEEEKEKHFFFNK